MMRWLRSLRIWWMRMEVDILRQEEYEHYLNGEHAKAYWKRRERVNLIDRLRALGGDDRA